MNFSDFQELGKTFDGELDINSFEDVLTGLLDLENEEFDLIAPQILERYQRTLNNPQDRIVLAQALNATNTKLEDVIETFQQLEEKIKAIELPDNKKDFLLHLIYMVTNTIGETEGVAKRVIKVPIEILENGKLPVYAHITDSGLDVYAAEDIDIKPGEVKIVKTGIKFALPIGYEFQVRARSGLSAKTHLRLANSIGTIDSSYRDELGIIMENNRAPIKDIDYEMSPDGNIKYIKSILYGETEHIEKGDRIAQIVLAETPKVAFYEVESVAEIGSNRGGGYGSTGMK